MIRALCRTCRLARRLWRRGCCNSCYQAHRLAVAAGTATWADLEVRGLVLPAQKKRCHLPPAKERRRR